MTLKLSHKLMLMTAAVVTFTVAGITTIGIWRAHQVVTDTATQDLKHMAAMAVQMCELNAEQSSKQVDHAIAVADRLFRDLSGSFIEVRDGKMFLGRQGSQMTINENYAFVDEIKALTGATCTIFLKEGDKAKRISTNVLDEKGNRAIGTYVSQKVYDAVIRDGQAFSGRAWVVTDWYVARYMPLRDSRTSQVVGILYVGVKERSDMLRKSLLAQKVGRTGYMYAIDTTGVLQIHPAKEGANLSQYDFIREMIAKAPKLAGDEIGWIRYPWINKELGETAPRDKIVAYAYLPEWQWIIGVGSYLEEFTQPVSSLRNTLLFIGLTCLLISVSIAYFLVRMIARPINGLVRVAEAVAQGDISLDAEVASRDEIGTLAESFRSVTAYLRELAHASERIAANDLTVVVEPKSSRDVLGNSFKTMIINLSGMIRQLTDNARELVSAATEISASSEQMSKGAKGQADQVAQVSTAIEEMSATIIEASKNAGEATDVAKGASGTAASGGQIVSDTIQGMQKIAAVVRQSAESIAKLAKSADQIGEITSVIDEIADQTNLLALNAAIEAARAGEQGRGFAVVADEVRKLAERTGTATKEITAMIKGIQSETEEAVNSMESGIQEVDRGRDLADKAGSSLHEIVTMSQRVMDMIAQIATASEEQSSTVEQISKNVEHIASVTRETSSGAEQSAAAAEELNRQAEGLQTMVGQFRLSTGDLARSHSASLQTARDDHQRYVDNLAEVIKRRTPTSSWKHTDCKTCRFGKWYHTVGTTAFGSTPAFLAIEDPHRRVHQAANDAVKALAEGDEKSAKRNLDLAVKASHDVIAAIRTLERSSVAV